MNETRKIFTFILIFVGSLYFIDLSYGQSSVSFRGVHRFETRTDFNNFWSGGGQPITETDGKVFSTDAKVGLAIWINNTQDGEILTWNFIRPDDTIRSSNNLTYDLDTDCWSGGGFFSWCGDPSSPSLHNVGWISGASIAGGMPGIWTINFLKNDALLFSEQFELVARVFNTVSGNDQKGLPGSTLSEPIVVELLDFDGNGLPDSSVTFEITTQLKGVKGMGLTETYNTPPLGTGITSITVTTDIEGIAKVFLELGNKEGIYSVTATAPDADTGSPQIFTAFAQNLVVGDLEMNAVNDVGLPGTFDPFFVAHFDAVGNIVVDVNEPIGGMVNDNFDLNIILNAFPFKPEWIPFTKWKWQIKGLGGPTNGSSFTDWGTTESITPVVKTPGPRSFGDHDMKLNFTFFDNNGSRVNTQKIDLKLKLFFDKNGDYNSNGEPNWYEFWKDDNVVPGLELFSYNKSFINTYAQFTSPNTLELGDLAPTENYPGGLVINGQQFGGEKGIDCVAVVVAHEFFHKWVYENNQPGGQWHGLTNSDKDDLPDNYELEIGTSPDNADTFGLAELIHPIYKDSGDEEYAAILAEKGNIGIYTKDWAFPGKQSDPSW